MPPPHAKRVFRRTLGSRLLSVVAVVLFAGLTGITLLQSPAGGSFIGLAVCALLLLISLLVLAANFGDRIVVEESGVRLCNVWREKLRIGGGRLLRWEEVEEVRELQPGRRTGTLPSARTLVVRTRAGRRWVFDSIEGIEEVAALLRRGYGLSGPCPSPPERRG
jgi:hypothetical protein